ncbi:MAG: hypothetical protein Q9219_004834 [cf. Caloplaca sp. 3 TL-2023]
MSSCCCSTFDNKLIAITGAASGIGLATAKKLASQGALLSIADLNADALAAAVPVLSELRGTYDDLRRQCRGGRGTPCSENGGVETKKKEEEEGGTSSSSFSNGVIVAKKEREEGIFATRLDIRDAPAVNAWIAKTTTYFHRPLDGAANMAGVVGPSLGLPRGSIRNVSEAETTRVLDVNMHGTWNCLRAELPAMVDGDQGGGGGGSIVNAASIAGLIGVANNAPYVMAKHAIVGLTKTAAKEEGERGIRVNAIAPGVVDTPMVEGIRREAGTTEMFVPGGDPGALGRKGTSGEVAGLVCFLLGEESSFVSGMVYGIDGGWVC